MKLRIHVVEASSASVVEWEKPDGEALAEAFVVADRHGIAVVFITRPDPDMD